MSILITRPSPYGERLVNKLLIIGKSAYHLPLTYFSIGKNLSLLKYKLNLLSAGDFLFVVSRYAVMYAHIQLLSMGISWPTQLKYYSIGRATSMIMSNLSGIAVKYSVHQETSEGLLSLAELINIRRSGQRALILSGNNSRVFLKNTLQERGVHVICCECYRRNFFRYNGIEQYNRMLSLNIKTVVITSEIILMQLYYLIPEYYRFSWLLQCQLIVVSSRLAVRAKSLGWKDVIVACSANNNILIQILMKYS